MFTRWVAVNCKQLLSCFGLVKQSRHRRDVVLYVPVRDRRIARFCQGGVDRRDHGARSEKVVPDPLTLHGCRQGGELRSLVGPPSKAVIGGSLERVVESPGAATVQGAR